jgi:hypothetical protein
LTANKDAAKEAVKMDEILDEIMEDTGLAQKWREEGIEQGKLEDAQRALTSGTILKAAFEVLYKSHDYRKFSAR